MRIHQHRLRHSLTFATPLQFNPCSNGTLNHVTSCPRFHNVPTIRRSLSSSTYKRQSSSRMVTAPGTETVPNNTTHGTLPKTTDVLVIGAGPAGLSLARALGERGINVVCVDPALERAWPNNYGTWLDELIPLGLDDCVSRVWKHTSVYTSDKKTVLTRAYARVDRVLLKRRLLERCADSGRVIVARAKASKVDVTTSSDWSMVHLDIGNVNARIVVDATGHALRFVKLAGGAPEPGYQAAYGIECEIEDDLTAFSSEEMLLMDYRDDHMKGELSEVSQNEPTFLYVMPMEGKRVFFEETSLVANPAMEFDKLKHRLYKRLDHYGIRVARVLDEENCLIPMGGALPDASQRVVAYGGAAAFVHPATGYMIARALTLADRTADGIVEALSKGGSADRLARQVWCHTWNERMLSQRDFLNYGGSYLQKIDLTKTRDFFQAFFKLPQEQWGGFLSFKLEEPIERLIFGLGVFYHTSNRVRSSLVWDSVTKGGKEFFLSLLPISWAKPRLPGSLNK